MKTFTCVRSRHNPNQTYEEFKAARADGWGASDMGALNNEGDYGCKRKLFLERVSLIERDEVKLQHHVERGKFLEAPVAELYQKRTQREVKLCGTGYIKEAQWLRANADRLIFGKPEFHEGNPHGSAGVLEIKCPAEHMFRKIKREGLPLEYILQLQWQMFCYGTTWGAFAIYWADGHELLTFDVARDDTLIDSMRNVANDAGVALGDLSDDIARGNVWQYSKYIPGVRDPNSKVCATCPMFDTCHGIDRKEGIVIQNDALVEQAQEFIAHKATIKALEARMDELKALFRAELKQFPCDYIRAGDSKIALSVRSRENLSSKAKEVLTAEQKLAYVSVTEYEVIDVKAIKK